MSRLPVPVIRTPPDRTILVTSGAGFVGSALCRLFAEDGAVRIVAFDSVPEGAALAALGGAPNFRFVGGDLGDRALLAEIFAEEHIDAVIHLAAEGEADRPHSGQPTFIDTAMTGTFHLLESALDHWRGLMPDARDRFRFVHATPGALADHPMSPLAAARIGAASLVRAWHDSFGLPVIQSLSSRSYGPFAQADAFIPTVIASAIDGRPVRVPGNGGEMLDWLHVDDHAAAVRAILYRGQVGETYPVAARDARSMIAVATAICDLIDRIDPRPDGRRRRSLITFVSEGAARTHVAAIDPAKTERMLGWHPLTTFQDGLLAEIDRALADRRQGARETLAAAMAG